MQVLCDDIVLHVLDFSSFCSVHTVPVIKQSIWLSVAHRDCYMIHVQCDVILSPMEVFHNVQE